MANLPQLLIKSTDVSLPPQERKLAKAQLGDYFRNLFYSVEVSRFLKNPAVPPIGSENSPYLQPDQVQEHLANHEFLIRELLLHALGDPSPQPSILAFLSEEETRYVTAKELLTSLEQAAAEMRQIVGALAKQ